MKFPNNSVNDIKSINISLGQDQMSDQSHQTNIYSYDLWSYLFTPWSSTTPRPALGETKEVRGPG